MEKKTAKKLVILKLYMNWLLSVYVLFVLVGHLFKLCEFPTSVNFFFPFN